ncbi:MAG: DNA polymerase III subunit beta [Candidatus Doudnabacteria bacterium]
MRFKINSKQLKTKLENLSKVSKTKTSLPILSCFKINVRERNVEITATDLDITLVAKVIPESVKEEGFVCVDAGSLLDIIKKIKDSVVEIYSEEKPLPSGQKKINVFVASPSGKFKMTGYDAEDFPQVHDPIDENLVTVPVMSISQGIGKTVHAVKVDEYRPTTGGVYLDFREDRMSFSATDGWSKVAILYDTSVQSGLNKSVILPKSASSVFNSLLESDDIDAEIMFDEKNMRIDLVGYTLYSKLIEGKPFDINSIMMQQSEIFFTANTQELLFAVDRCLTLGNSVGVVDVSVLLGEVLVSSENIDFDSSGEERVACENKQSSGMFKCNGRFFVEALGKISTEKVEVSFSTTNPMIFINPTEMESNYTMVLMRLV